MTENIITNLVEFIDSERIQLDMLIQSVGSIKSEEYKDDIRLAYNELRLAKCWLGKLKGALGTETPYKVVSEVKDIPKTAEVYEGDIPSISTEDKLNAVNFLRKVILERIDALFTLGNIISYEGLGTEEVQHAIKHLHQARFYLGFELGNMRDSQIPDK